jgi:hypothetical protein
MPSTFYAATPSDLIADITAANQAGGTNTITLVAPTTSPYTLTAIDNTTDGATGLPVIAANLTIVGNGDFIQRSTAAGTPAFRLLDVAGGASLTLQNLTLQNGLAQGGGVSARGGAVYNQGSLDLNAVTVQNNIARGLGYHPAAAGGGVYSNSALTMEGGTKVQNNQALGGFGGAGYGGGVDVAGGSATLSSVTFSSNTAQGGQGSTSAPAGPGYGGALYVAGGTVTLTSALLASNAARGGPQAYGSFAGNGFGGALYLAGGTVILRNDTLTGNSAAGGTGYQPGLGEGDGLFINSAAAVYLDTFTQAHVINNTASTRDPNIHGRYNAHPILLVGGFSSPTTAGAVGSVTVTALDSSGNTMTGYTGTVHFSSSDPQAVLPGDYTFTAADQGVHTFTNGVTLKTAGSQTITATGTTIPAGIISLWSADGNANDIVGSNNGTLVGGVTFAPGVVGQAFSLNGTSAYVSVPDAPSLNLTGAITVATWINPTAHMGPYDPIVKKAGGGTAQQGGYALEFLGNNVVFWVYISGLGWSASPTAFVPLGQWSHVAGTYDGSGLSLFVNGQLIGTSLVSGQMSPSVNPLEIGHDPSNANRWYDGLIDEAAVYNRALSAAEIQGMSMTGTERGIWVNPAAASTLSVSGFPSPLTAGSAGSFTVTAVDVYGNTASGYKGTVAFASSDAQASLPAAYTFTAADHGSHTFSATLKTAGTQSITAKDTAAPAVTGTQTRIVVSPTTPARFSVATPANATIGTPFSITVTAWDAYSNIATNYTGTVSFMSTDRAAILPGPYAFTAADQGVHTFTNGVTLKTAGSQTITATGTAIPAGLISWWPGEGNANDIVGGNNGVLVGGVTFAPGEVGQAFSLNGSSAYVSAPSTTLTGLLSHAFSIELWANFNSIPGSSIGNPGDVFIGKDEGGGNQNKWFFAYGGGVLNFHLNSSSIAGAFLVQAPYSFNLHQWYHLAVTRSGALYTIYVNGAAVGSQSFSASIPEPNAPVTIGEAEGLGFVNGLLDEVSVYNRALSPAEIQWIYNAGSAGKHKTITGSASVTVGTGPTSATTLSLTPVGTAPTAGIPVNAVVAAEVTSGNIANGDAHVGMVPFKSTGGAGTKASNVVLKMTPPKSGSQKITAVDQLFAWKTGSDVFDLF